MSLACSVIVALAMWQSLTHWLRFKRCTSIDAIIGSVRIDKSGRISKCRDRLLRTFLFQAANAMLTRVHRASAFSLIPSTYPLEQVHLECEGCALVLKDKGPSASGCPETSGASLDVGRMIGA